jgi:DNA (cytosine-5)-methyltransferase 1
MKRSLNAAGLFAGIGGLDLGLKAAGHQVTLLAEWDPAAQAVLRHHFPDVELRSDVAEIKNLPAGIDLVTGGFPCQDISQAGRRDGLAGARSGMVWEFFRLIDGSRPDFFVLENVANLLSLESGRALRILLETIESLGYRWAYRLVDTRGFGLPQRRQRVIFLASRGEVAPENVLFSSSYEPEHDDEPLDPREENSYGFYWTEGRRGVGWTENAVPTIKGGSGLGIPSPPAVYVTKNSFAGTPTIEDGERLQGFEPRWTEAELDGRPLKLGARWKLIGNAVSVPVSDWLGEQLAHEEHPVLRDMLPATPLRTDRPMPRAAFGAKGKWFTVDVGTHVRVPRHLPIMGFLRDPLMPLSTKALAGYVNRASQSTRRIPMRFLRDLRAELTRREQSC